MKFPKKKVTLNKLSRGKDLFIYKYFLAEKKQTEITTWATFFEFDNVGLNNIYSSGGP